MSKNQGRKIKIELENRDPYIKIDPNTKSQTVRTKIAKNQIALWSSQKVREAVGGTSISGILTDKPKRWG
jgi:hypothetical protein